MDGMSRFQKFMPKFDSVSVALETMHACELMEPMAIPEMPSLSPELFELVNAPMPSSVPKQLRPEFDAYVNARTQRANARGENERRLRTLLWAEKTLRDHARDEHEVLRAFNRDVWGVTEPAASDVAAMEAQVRAHK
jgi:hypothetical protein